MEDNIVHTPKKLADKRQAYFWFPAWQAAERVAGGGIGAGRIHETATVEELLAELETSRKKPT